MDNAKYTRLRCAIKWFLGVSLVFQLVGYFTPGWVYRVENEWIEAGPNRRLMIGLWYLIQCDKDKCVSRPLSDWGTDWDIRIVGPQVEATLALFLCIVAVYITHKKPNNNSTEEKQSVLTHIHMICCSLSSILSITAVATWINFAFARGYKGSSRTDIPFSLPLTGLGGVLAGLAFLTNVIWRPWKHASLPFHNHGNGFDNPAVSENIDAVYDPATQTDNVFPLGQTGSVHLSMPTGTLDNAPPPYANQQQYFQH